MFVMDEKRKKELLWISTRTTALVDLHEIGILKAWKATVKQVSKKTGVTTAARWLTGADEVISAISDASLGITVAAEKAQKKTKLAFKSIKSKKDRNVIQMAAESARTKIEEVIADQASEIMDTMKNQIGTEDKGAAEAGLKARSTLALMTALIAVIANMAEGEI